MTDVDARVGRRVFGLTEPPRWIDVSGRWRAEYPAYSTDMTAAWAVVLTMNARGYGVNFGNYNGRNTWSVWFGRHNDEDYRGEAKSAPLAICLAALPAVE